MQIPSPNVPVPSAEWTPMVREIQANSAAGFDLLYRRLKSYLGFFITKVGPEHGQDLYHEFILQLVAQIQRGALRDPERLPAYARTMAHRHVIPVMQANWKARNTEIPAEDIRCALRDDPGPEKQAIQREQEEIAGRILHSLPKRDREVLIRFYLKEQAAERIQADLDLTGTQFRLIKSRAKTRFTVLCQERLERKSPIRASTVSGRMAGPTRKARS
jgi:RNA polymerase sigma-70 factor, ECF subfamily